MAKIEIDLDAQRKEIENQKLRSTKKASPQKNAEQKERRVYTFQGRTLSEKEQREFDAEIEMILQEFKKISDANKQGKVYKITFEGLKYIKQLNGKTLYSKAAQKEAEGDLSQLEDFMAVAQLQQALGSVYSKLDSFLNSHNKKLFISRIMNNSSASIDIASELVGMCVVAQALKMGNKSEAVKAIGAYRLSETHLSMIETFMKVVVPADVKDQMIDMVENIEIAKKLGIDDKVVNELKTSLNSSTAKLDDFSQVVKGENVATSIVQNVVSKHANYSFAGARAANQANDRTALDAMENENKDAKKFYLPDGESNNKHAAQVGKTLLNIPIIREILGKFKAPPVQEKRRIITAEREESLKEAVKERQKKVLVPRIEERTAELAEKHTRWSGKRATTVARAMVIAETENAIIERSKVLDELTSEREKIIEQGGDTSDVDARIAITNQEQIADVSAKMGAGQIYVMYNKQKVHRNYKGISERYEKVAETIKSINSQIEDLKAELEQSKANNELDKVEEIQQEIVKLETKVAALVIIYERNKDKIFTPEQMAEIDELFRQEHGYEFSEEDKIRVIHSRNRTLISSGVKNNSRVANPTAKKPIVESVSDGRGSDEKTGPETVVAPIDDSVSEMNEGERVEIPSENIVDKKEIFSEEGVAHAPENDEIIITKEELERLIEGNKKRFNALMGSVEEIQKFIGENVDPTKIQKILSTMQGQVSSRMVSTGIENDIKATLENLEGLKAIIILQEIPDEEKTEMLDMIDNILGQLKIVKGRDASIDNLLDYASHSGRNSDYYASVISARDNGVGIVVEGMEDYLGRDGNEIKVGAGIGEFAGYYGNNYKTITDAVYFPSNARDVDVESERISELLAESLEMISLDEVMDVSKGGRTDIRKIEGVIGVESVSTVLTETALTPTVETFDTVPSENTETKEKRTGSQMLTEEFLSPFLGDARGKGRANSLGGISKT